MPEWVRWLAVILATLRATWALMFDDGPCCVLRGLRTRMGTYDYGAEIGPDGRPQAITTLGRFLNCPYCVSLAVALLAVPLALWPSILGDVLLTWLGIAGGAMLLIRWRPWR